MVISGHEEIEFESDIKKDKIRSFKDCSDVEYSIEVEALVTRRSLDIHIKKDNIEK
jgi:hypothetical protein